MSDSGIAYNPADPVQQNFLSALALGESGKSGGLFTGTGGSDLSGASKDQYGFPIWNGQGNSHAAGIYQFQPGTWKTFASQYGLDFGNPADQNAGAWYDAQSVYAAKTGGDLETALKNGDYSSIQSALSSEWTSVTGNGAAPQGLAADLAAGVGAAIPSGSSAGTGKPFSATDPSTWFAEIQNIFVRFGLVAIGGLIVAIALWALVSHYTDVPSPVQTGKALAL